MTKTATAEGGLSLRKYNAVIRCLTGILQDATVPAELKLEAAKELDTIYRRADASRERQRARDFRLKVLTLDREKTKEADGEAQAAKSSIMEIARQEEADLLRLGERA